MNKLIKYIILFLTIGLFGCAEDNINAGKDSDEIFGGDPQPTGIIDFSAAIDVAVSASDVLSRADSEKVYNWRDLPKSKTADDLEVVMYRSDGTVYNKWASSKSFPKNGSFPTGTYSIVAKHGDVKKEGFDSEANHKHPAFYDSVTVTVQEGKSSTVTLNAGVQNSLIGIRLSDKFRKYLKENKAEFDIAFTPESKLTHSFAGDTAQTLYLTPGKVTGELIVRKGELSASVKVNEFEAKKATYHFFTIDRKDNGSDENNGELTISVTYADEFIEESFEHQLIFEDAPVPVIDVQGDENSTFYEGNDNKAGKLVYTVAARGGMKEVKLQVTRNGNVNEIDLLSQKTSADIDCKGIVSGGVFGLVDVSSYLGSLVTGTIGEKGENIVFRLTVTDLLGQKADSKELILTLLPEKSVLEKPSGLKEPVGDSFDLILTSTMDNLDTNPERLKLYTKDGYFIDSELSFKVKNKVPTSNSDFFYEYSLEISPTPAYSMEFDVRGVSSTGKDCGTVKISRSAPKLKISDEVSETSSGVFSLTIELVNKEELQLLQDLLKNEDSFRVTLWKKSAEDWVREDAFNPGLIDFTSGKVYVTASDLSDFSDYKFVIHYDGFDNDQERAFKTSMILPELLIEIDNKDVFAHYATGYISLADPTDWNKTKLNWIISKQYNLQGLQLRTKILRDCTQEIDSIIPISTVLSTPDEKLEFVLNYLQDGKENVVYADYIDLQESASSKSFTTEEAIKLYNGDMEGWTRIPGQTNYWWIDYLNGNNLFTWATMNELTTSQGGSSTLGTGNSRNGCAYNATSGTQPTGDKHSGSQAALIRTVGWGAGNTAAVLSGNFGTCNNVTAGELFLGAYSDNITYGIDFTSRPNIVKFWYKYKTVKPNDDKGVFNASINDSNNYINSGDISLVPQDNYTEYNFEFDYSKDFAKARNIVIVFKSTFKDSNTLMSQKNSTYMTSPPGMNLTNGEYVGSELYIDDVELIYSWEKPKQ